MVCLFPFTAKAQNFTTFTEWPVPTAGSEPLSVVTASKSTAFFTERTASKLGLVDMNKSVITEWTLPAGPEPHGLILQGQTVVIGEQNGHVAELDPNTNVLTEWAVPDIEGFTPDVVHVAAQGKSVFFADVDQGVIGMLNLSFRTLE